MTAPTPPPDPEPSDRVPGGGHGDRGSALPPQGRRRRIAGALRAILRTLTAGCLGALVVWGAWWTLSAPSSPLPPEWNPLRPLDLSRPATPVTRLQLRRALSSADACRAALGTGADFDALPPLEAEGGCGIAARVRLSRAGPARIAPLETSCPAALRLAAWTVHGLAPAIRDLGTGVAALQHQGSYNCRPVRGGRRLSTHATGEAIDIRGIVLSDGRVLELVSGWDDAGPEGAVWRAARDSACDWFVTVLGPDYNALHADHFHLQSTGWGTCR